MQFYPTQQTNDMNFSTEQSATYYNSIASGYDALYGDEQYIKLRCISDELRKLSVSFPHTARVLDVGCGSGISSDFFARLYGAQIMGIDPAEFLIRENKNHLCEFVVGSAEHLPFSDATFDLVLSVSAIQNFSDIGLAIIEMKRVAKPGALFILTYMAKGNDRNDVILGLIRAEFSVLSEFWAKNDVVCICRNH
jgi:ubiquinone/menaquinone biosynthesis C-methylase UbiE